MKPFNQQKFAKSVGYDHLIGDGACFMLTADWLRDRENFWEEVSNAPYQEQLLNGWFRDVIIPGHEAFQEAIKTGNFEPLVKDNFNLKLKQVINDIGSFFTNTGYGYIEDLIFGRKEKYMMVGLKREVGQGHVIGLQRDPHITSKDDIYFFDSNSGEVNFKSNQYNDFIQWFNRWIYADYQELNFNSCIFIFEK